MANIVFVNPNDPEQPTAGVYRWFFRSRTGAEVTFYVGEAGKRQSRSVRKPSTLARGVMEAQRSCLSSDGGSTLDTDFIVGSAIMYLQKKGYDCSWQHVSSDPNEEVSKCKEFQPILQHSAKCTITNKCRHEDKYWSKERVKEAESELWSWFDKVFTVK